MFYAPFLSPGKNSFFHNGAECSLYFIKPHTQSGLRGNKWQFNYFKSHTYFLLTCQNICHSKSVLEKPLLIYLILTDATAGQLG